MSEQGTHEGGRAVPGEQSVYRFFTSLIAHMKLVGEDRTRVNFTVNGQKVYLGIVMLDEDGKVPINEEYF